MELLLIGDVGGPDTYHVGDEAMLEANLAELSYRYPDATFTVVTADPEATSRRYGVEALRPLGFAGDGSDGEAGRERLLADVVRRAERAAGGAAEPEPGIVGAVRRADAVIVSGGGNLSSTWPEHLYERVALLRIAGCFGKPTLVLGQTLGPELGPRERELLGSALCDADLVGVREAHSLRYARVLGVPQAKLSLQLDDAFFLTPEPGDSGRAEPGDPGPWIAVTLTRGVAPIGMAARQLALLAREVGARLMFVPHARAPDHDPVVGSELAAALEPDVDLKLLDVENARVSRWRIEKAAMVISNRYHPLVFALAAGIPCMGVHVDEYTRVKLTGALEHAGLADWTLPWFLAREGALLEAARELWERRDAVRRQIGRHRDRWKAQHRNHWRRIERVLGGDEAGEPDAREPAVPEAVPDARPAGSWSCVSRSLRTRSDRFAQQRLELIHERDEAVRYAVSLRSALAARDEEIAAVRRTLETAAKQPEEAMEGPDE